MADRNRRTPLGGLLLVAVVLTTAEVARAEVVVRPHARVLLAVQSGAVAGGGETGVSLGYDPELEPLLIIPEVSASFGGFGGDYSGIGMRALGGVRGGVAGPVEPSLSLRVGYGLTSLAGGGGPESGVAFDVGLGLDVRTKRWLTLGAELVYDLLVVPLPGSPATLHTFGAGGNVAFWF